ncbi:sigma 54 modulation/S30EA ribosomal C-terminal domain-containing protein [Streptoalloteichus tenebrarius]|uniref:sigma 54 modulation/S30EA ribosomal C-terminal domain-containing protein n=1 Tax=Streptoalloteichus tenebrarius (strain ATCC 17920 / DSM 40477 / JCM 4838 / CBS 697.72 / NBRC 16177 / NCIMB 11028 / NRRL B-12390 / A12253. 1 / ISP 5477) TaxID=1933 RepID=UPI0020A42F4B|nr:sigma 54 modulation/S30EA ribosomal C-terminal domain-containing protein [Streptoalloteichus tenebrarius]
MSARAQDYARDKVLALSRCCPGPVPYVRIKLTRSHDPSVPTPALVQVNLDVDGSEVRAQAAAPTFTEAVDLVQDRLRERLRRLARTHRDRHGAAPRGVPSPRAALPAEEPRVVRHKTYAPERLLPEEAAFDMELMDYDFFLFRDATTDQDSVVFRDANGQPRLVRMRPAGISPTPFPVAGTGAPRLSVVEAVQRLETTGDRFVFFADQRTGRGHVVYRRYDGRYGLISPVR